MKLMKFRADRWLKDINRRKIVDLFGRLIELTVCCSLKKINLWKIGN